MIEPCPQGDCKDRLKCWEPCGLLGTDERHVQVVPAEVEAATQAIVDAWAKPTKGES